MQKFSSDVTSINQFFSQIQCDFHCYNLARLIQIVDHQTFIDFENNNIPWHAPFLQCAWIALVFWKTSKKQSTSNNQHVWFLKLPLDEQAKLNLAARDDFLHRLIDALTNRNSTIDTPSALENALKDNPYGFQPKEEQMANFHAIVQQQFKLPASRYYPAVVTYLSNEAFSSNANFEQWTQLGLQGVADFAARLDHNHQHQSNEQRLIKHISQLPSQLFKILATCLENHRLSKALSQAIYQRLKKNLHDENECVAAIRATAQTEDKPLQKQMLDNILTSSIGSNIEVLAAMSSRCWEVVIQAELLAHFLEALANAQAKHPNAFNSILSDLMFIPNIRQSILISFRSPERSTQLSQAIGAFFNQEF